MPRTADRIGEPGSDGDYAPYVTTGWGRMQNRSVAG